MSILQAGVARETITPPVGTLLMGYTPMRPALGIHDDLHLCCFALQSGDTLAMLIAADLCNIYYPQEKLRAAVTEASGVPGSSIILSCTHTHSGPTTHETPEGIAYMESIFIPQLQKAAAAAVANLKPAQVGWGTVWSDVAVNRRMLREDGRIVLGQDPHGTWDPTMTVISFREPDGTPIGNVIQYGCHNTASGKNDDVTRDWCGVAIDRLEAVSGGITAFINGCGGDCGPRLANGRTTANLQMAMELGGKAALDAVKAWRSIRRWEEVPVKVLQGTFEMPLAEFGTAEEMTQRAAAMGDPEKMNFVKRKQHDVLLRRAEYLQQGNVPPRSRPLELTVLSLGGLAICALPFEIFSRITLRIKEHSPFEHTLVPGYSNGGMGYFPSTDQLCRGGYEVEMFLYSRLLAFSDDAEQHLVAGSLQLLRELYGK